MLANPEVEVSVSSPEYAWIRLNGKAVFEAVSYTHLTQFDPELVDIMLRLIDSGRIDIDNLYKDGEADEDK